jgi:hypothetical protein
MVGKGALRKPAEGGWYGCMSVANGLKMRVYMHDDDEL